MSTANVLSFGYGNRDGEAVLALLRHHGTQIVVDVRSAPYSRHRPDFNKHLLQRAVRGAGMRYWFFGSQLGGRPTEGSRLVDGRLDLDACLKDGVFRRCITRLICAAQMGATVALLCAEEDPRRCHRYHLLGEALLRRGVDVVHLLADGAAVTQTELRMQDRPAQLSLFVLPA